MSSVFNHWKDPTKVPSVIFDVSTPLNIKMTSPGTRSKDDVEKKNLYESLGVTEYWQFAPRGEWIPEQLRGYRLQGDSEPVYVPIANNQSTELQLQLVVEEKIIAFYRLDDGARLLPIAFGASEAIEELNTALEEQNMAFEEQSVTLDRQKELTEQETQRADRAAQKVQDLEAQIALYQGQLGEQTQIDRD
jgi:Putative restriction endonuclease